MEDNRSMASTAWASWINVILGIWLIISPWVLGFSGHPAAVWNTFLLGILVLVAGLAATSTRSSGPSWWNVAFGVWLIISPFILDYSSYQMPTANDIVLGVIVGILGLAAGTTKYSTGHRAISH